MAGYKHPCRHCGKLVPPDSNACPFCGKNNPLSMRCPKCMTPIEKGWIRCPKCGLSLNVICPSCGKTTFFDDYCEHCDKPITVVCPNPRCKTEQPPVGDKCKKCGKPLK